MNNVGTIAKSCTMAFVKATSAGGDISLIGQIGVGFYPVYLVSDQVREGSRNNDDEQHIWESAAGIHRADRHRDGPWKGQARQISCYWKEDESEFLEERRRKELEKKAFGIQWFYIELHVEKSKESEVTDSEEDKEDEEGTKGNEQKIV